MMNGGVGVCGPPILVFRPELYCFESSLFFDNIQLMTQVPISESSVDLDLDSNNFLKVESTLSS